MTIPEYLKREGLSRRAFAERMGVSPSSLTDWLEHGAVPDGESIRKVVRGSRGEIAANDLLGIVVVSAPTRDDDKQEAGGDAEEPAGERKAS